MFRVTIYKILWFLCSTVFIYIYIYIYIYKCVCVCVCVWFNKTDILCPSILSLIRSSLRMSHLISGMNSGKHRIFLKNFLPQLNPFSGERILKGQNTLTSYVHSYKDLGKIRCPPELISSNVSYDVFNGSIIKYVDTKCLSYLIKHV